MQSPLGSGGVGSWSDSADPLTALLAAFPSGCILLQDSLAASGHFLLPWVVANSIKQGHKVVLVAAAYSVSKYQAALRKLGVSSAAVVSSSHQQQQQQQGPISIVSAAGACNSSDSSSSGSSWQYPRALYQQVEAAARQVLGLEQQDQPHSQQQQQQLTVVLDSLACLSALMSSVSCVDVLLHQLMALGEVLQVPCRLVLLAAGDIPSQRQLLLSVASRAHVTGELLPLEGRTAALDGSMAFKVRKAAPRPCFQQQQQQQQLVAPSAGGAASVPCGVPAASWLFPGSSSNWFFRAGDVGVKWMPEVLGKELMA